MRVLTMAEQQQILNSVEKELGLRNATLIRVMLFTGVRVSELVGLNMDDVFFGGNVKKYLVVRADIAKGGKAREVPLSDRLMTDLAKYYLVKCSDIGGATPAPSTPLYCTTRMTKTRLTDRQVQRIVRMAGELAGIHDLSPHALRHTFATRLMKITDMRTVQILLGHRSLQSTQVYTHPSSDDMTKAVNGL